MIPVNYTIMFLIFLLFIYYAAVLQGVNSSKIRATVHAV